MKVVSDNNKFEREPLWKLDEVLTTNMAELRTIGGICAVFIDDPTMGREVQKIVTEVPKKIADWTEAKLETAWPKVVKEFAQEEITKLTLDYEKYNILAENIRIETLKRAPKRFFHQVLVWSVLSGAIDNDNIISCSTIRYKRTCVSLIEKGLHAMISRHSDADGERESDASNWINTFGRIDNIKKILEESGSNPLWDIFKTIADQVGPLTKLSLFRNAAVVRCIDGNDENQIIMGLSTSSYQSYKNIEYWKPHGFWPWQDSIQVKIIMLS